MLVHAVLFGGFLRGARRATWGARLRLRVRLAPIGPGTGRQGVRGDRRERGIGLEVGRRLCAEGARVLFVGRDAGALKEAASGCGGEYLAVDVTDPEADERIVATCAEQMGGVDVLVNNAGTSFARPLDELTDDDWQRPVGAARDGVDAADARRGPADGGRRRRADRQRLLQRGQAPVADECRLLG